MAVGVYYRRSFIDPFFPLKSVASCAGVLVVIATQKKV